MSRLDPATARERLIAHRERRRAAGRVLVTTDLPGDLVALVDQTKEERGASARAAIIEEALRFYFEQKQRA
ncbi:ribbon-helix-helix protein, CopG family [Shinella sp. HY16]|nr:MULTISPECIES: ribbon-helix-helix protein, CopG family [unclassified Shinella]MDC7260385.1 ribbon-helix-helix protein, CopG family [Shinella sp. YE25]MDC7267237.1 ribbon-helix-helix protein, CopG family [Shinella sp. HY16]MDC7274144.1 ribbon-helix-helix protein, CopG family [Shinella sp. YZ44]